MRLETICGICERFIKLRSFGVCDSCLFRLSNKRIIICKRCKKQKPLHCDNLCNYCYVALNRKPEYHREQERKRREARRPEITTLNRVHGKNKRLKKRAQYDAVITPLKVKCVKCGYNRCKNAIDFHHKDRKTKKFGINMDTWSKLPLTMPIEKKLSIFLKEMKKCILLCATCHREIENGVWTLKDLTLNNQIDNIRV